MSIRPPPWLLPGGAVPGRAELARLARGYYAAYSEGRNPVDVVGRALELAEGDDADSRPLRIVCELLYATCVEQKLIADTRGADVEGLLVAAEEYITETNKPIVEFSYRPAAGGAA